MKNNLILTFFCSFISTILLAQTTFQPDTIRQSFHKNGKVQGLCIFIGYDSSANRQFVMQSFDKLGRPIKEYTLTSDTIESKTILYSYYKSGQLKSKLSRPQSTSINASDYYSGYQITYYKTGGTKDEGKSLLNNGLIGHWKYYYEDGALRMQGEWKNFKKIGVWQYYQSDGTLKRSKTYSLKD